LSTSVTIEMVYKEISDLRRLLEEFVERLIEGSLPEEELSSEEMEEIDRSLEEIRKGEYVTLKELEEKYVGKHEGIRGTRA